MKREWVGVCKADDCRRVYKRWSVRKPDYCQDNCRKRAHGQRQREREREGRDKKQETLTRQESIDRRIKSGELTQVPGNQCPACQTKVAMDSEPLTGRTVQTCGCGTRFLGRWA